MMMGKPGNLIRAAATSGVLMLASAPVLHAQEIPAGVAGYRSHVQAFFQQHCVRCHGPETSKGKITVHALDGDLSLGQELERWESILDVLEFGEMPPEGEPQPDAGEREQVAAWIESGLRDYVERASRVAAEPTTRRMTNVEYENTLSDLIGFELDVIDDLPEDPEKHYHFNNTAELMRMGPEQLDRYLEIARRAMASAIVDPGGPPEVFRVRREWNAGGNDRGLGADEVGVWGNRRNTAANGIAFKDFPKTGEYRIRMSASAILPAGYAEAPLNLDMGTEPGRTETPYKTVATVYLTNGPDDPQVFEFTGRIENHPSAMTQVGKPPNATLVDQMTIRPRIIFDDGTLNDGYGNTRQLELPRAVINWIELEVPVIDQWPPAHHQAILFDSPLRESDPDAYVRAVLQRFMTRAYRRPASADEVDRFVRIYNLIRRDVQTLEAAMRETLAMVLITPQFLYHTEADPAMDAHYALASRLSYYLWASMPDQELIDLAAQKKLDDPAVIEQQVVRMIEDEKADAFIESFTMQWLSIRKSLTVPINPDLFPRFLYRVAVGETAGLEMPYHPSVRAYMIQETVGFVGILIRENRSALNVVDSDFAYLNERLAAHYGIEGVKGMRLRKVPIEPEDNLGGLLTHGSVLIGNGTGTAPHPIYRAVWLREAILGDKVAPPPSEVPALSDTAGESAEKALTIADLLAQHRNVESCNDCHVRLDPWGIPFEHYNAVGQYQPSVPKEGVRVSRMDNRQFDSIQAYQAYLDSINTETVNARARVPHGPEIDGMRELKAFLLEEREQDIAENMVRRLLAYGIGRELNYRDRFVVEQLLEQAEGHGYQLRDIIVSICQSETFRDLQPESE